MREFVHCVHFVGIGGTGMSGIAAVLHDQGFKVSGSDIRRSSVTDWLADRGIVIAIGHQAAQVMDADAVVVSSAVSADNPEIIAARRQGIPVLPRAQMLGELMRFRRGIAVAGTHGKTTTTSLIAEILLTAGLDPTFIVGGVVKSAQGSARLGDGDYLVAEADESDSSFLHLHPLVAVITNIDADHLEAYDEDFDQLIRAFDEFLKRLPFYGLAILCADDPVLQDLRKRVSNPVVTYGTSLGADYRAVDIRQKGQKMYFCLCMPGESNVEVELALAGKHNVLNALAAIGIAHQLGVDLAPILKTLSQFQGVGRRFEVLGELVIGQGKALLVDDYAHHPTEIAATLDAAQNCWPERRRVVVFQPHRYTRTQALFDAFCDVLSSESHLLISDVYTAGESVIEEADGQSLCRAIASRTGIAPTFVKDLSDLKAALVPILRPDDVVWTLGAGDIGRCARMLLPTVGQSDMGTES